MGNLLRPIGHLSVLFPRPAEDRLEEPSRLDNTQRSSIPLGRRLYITLITEKAEGASTGTVDGRSGLRYALHYI